MKKLMLCAAVALLAVGTQPPAVHAEGHAEAPAKSTIETLIESRAASVVSVKLTLAVKISVKANPAQGGEQEVNRVGTGIVVDKSGLILVPNSITSFIWPNPAQREMLNINSSPNNIRITFPGDETEYAGILGAQDSTLGVAFILIKDLKGKEITPVDMSNAATPVVGQTLYGVTRLDEGFDHAAICDKVRIVGAVTKPRDMWIVNGANPFSGQPLYTEKNEIAGIVISQEGVGENVSRRPFLLPLGIANAKIRQAKKKSEDALERILEEEAEAAEAAAEEAAAGEGDEKDGEKKEGEKKDGDAAKEGGAEDGAKDGDK